MCKEPVRDRPASSPRPGVILSWGRQGHKHTQPCHLCHLTLTGGLLVPVCFTGHRKMKAIGGWGLEGEGVGNQMTGHMTMLCIDNTSKQDCCYLSGCIFHNVIFTNTLYCRYYRGLCVCMVLCNVITVILSQCMFFPLLLWLSYSPKRRIRRSC